MSNTETSERICVIIPAYNMGKYLRSCIDSVLAQTYSNIRVVLVDDGSTDNTGEICDEYEKKDARFTAVHTENKGQGMARNIGIENCTEKYLAMVDADDCISTTFISSLYEVMKESGADMVSPSYILFHNDDEIDLNINAGAPCEYRVYTRDEAMEKLTRYSAYFVMPQNLYKAELFSDYNYPDETFNVDIWAIHHLIVRLKKMAVSKNSVYFWRQSPEGMTRNFSTNKISGVLSALDRADTAEKHGYSEHVPCFEREFHMRAVEFYRRCRKRNLDGKEALKPHKSKLVKVYRINGEEYKRLFSRKERLLHWVFARNFTLFDILDQFINDSTRDHTME